MARKKSPTLTEAELRIMQALWQIGQGAVAEVHAALPDPESLAYNTVLTTLRILEGKGYVRHEPGPGRAYIYSPLVDREAARRETLGQVVRQFFDGSPSALVLNLLESEDLDEAELERLRRMIREAGEK
ncbi:MAG: BlaI/MecI/CopY family transcriptional regulator [Acidobacteria bacterium]|nr:BlaI/MecI/CopY family transcriptional regulator [Acidobacteriota bacterium]